MRVKCLAQEHNTMSPARARTRSARSGVERTNHEATAPQAVEDGINLDLANTIQWFQQNGMIANPDKYQALVLGNTAQDFDIKCEEKPIPVSS